jgi:hypothetical protein
MCAWKPHNIPDQLLTTDLQLTTDLPLFDTPSPIRTLPSVLEFHQFCQTSIQHLMPARGLSPPVRNWQTFFASPCPEGFIFICNLAKPTDRCIN